jgi:hypothetical protein
LRAGADLSVEGGAAVLLLTDAVEHGTQGQGRGGRADRGARRRGEGVGVPAHLRVGRDAAAVQQPDRAGQRRAAAHDVAVRPDGIDHCGGARAPARRRRWQRQHVRSVSRGGGGCAQGERAATALLLPCTLSHHTWGRRGAHGVRWTHCNAAQRGRPQAGCNRESGVYRDGSPPSGSPA